MNDKKETTPILALILLGLLGAMLACGPAAPGDINQSAGIQSPSPQEAPQETPEPEPEPTPVTVYALEPGEDPFKTPIPGLTRTPTNTPRPTLIPDSPEAYAAAAAWGSGGASVQSEPPLAQQVENFTREKRDGRQFHSIVRAKVTGHRLVEPNLAIEWPDEIGNPPYAPSMDLSETYVPWRRSKLKVEETYLGPLPEGYELLAPEYGVNEALEKDKEYIIYILRGYVAEDTLPDDPGVYRYNEEQLKALGGEGGFLHLSNTWLIDGGTAWLLPRDSYMTVNPYIPGLEAAREHGRSMALTDLVGHRYWIDG